MSDTPPLCSLRHAKTGRVRRIRTDDPSPWLAQGYELVDATHASAEAIKAVEAKKPSAEMIAAVKAEAAKAKADAVKAAPAS